MIQNSRFFLYPNSKVQSNQERNCYREHLMYWRKLETSGVAGPCLLRLLSFDNQRTFADQSASCVIGHEEMQRRSRNLKEGGQLC